MADENKDTPTLVPAVRLETADSGISASPELAKPPHAEAEGRLEPLPAEPQEPHQASYPSALEAGSSSDDVC